MSDRLPRMAVGSARRRKEGRGSGLLISLTTPHQNKQPPTPTHKKQLDFYLLYIVEFCMSFCLKRLCYCVKSTALVASHLRAREYFDLNKKEEFSDSLA